MDLAVLEETLAARGQPAYRARQVWEWAARGAGGLEELTNLPAALRAELAQALHFRRSGPLTHCVFMGMGEPMMNLDAVLEAARRLPDVGITHRRTTISTVGWLPGLTRFVSEVEQPIRLAISLHAPDDALRSMIMPVNLRYPLTDVLAEAERWFGLRRQKVFVEYVMLRGLNDRVEEEAQLGGSLGGRIYEENMDRCNRT